MKAALALQGLHQSDADAIVFALYGRDLGAEAVLQSFVFVGQNFHALLIGEEVFEVVLDKDPNSLFRFVASLETSLQLLQDRSEGIFLDQVEQAFFRSEVMVKAGQ